MNSLSFSYLGGALTGGILLAALAAGCSGGSSSGPGGNNGAGPGANSIVFVSNRDGNPEIYRMNADGSSPLRLTNSSGADNQPNQSRDRQRIVFESNRDGNSEIYIMNADGSGLQRLTNDSGASAPVDSQPVFSPDGSTIAWTSNRGNSNETDIWLMDSTGANQRRFTQSAAEEATFNPAFSPDGSRIAYFAEGPRQRYRRETLEFKNLSTGAITTTTFVTSIPRHLRFSPDGSKIILSDQIPNTNPGRIRIFDVNTQVAALGPSAPGPIGSQENQSPDYSPDGTAIVWHVSAGFDNNGPIGQIFVANADGSNVRSITSQGSNLNPDW